MPIPNTPPVPPALPQASPHQQQFIDQWQKQNQNQQADFNNGYSPTNSSVDSSTSNSTSESQNVVSQSGSLVNLQQNYNHDTYFRYSTGTHIPTTSLNLGASLLPNGQEVIQANIHIPFGGRARKLAHREVELATVSKEASICTGVIKAGVDVSQVESLSFCNNYKTIAKPPVAVPASTEAAMLKKQMQEQLAALKKQQETIEALKLRLIQIQHQPTEVKATY